MVREELLELDERKKRRASLVIRGLGASYPADAVAKFAEVAHSLIGAKVVLSEPCRIKPGADLFRGNVHNSQHRKVILEEARNLRNSSFSHVFIKQDLTYMQRLELQARFQHFHKDKTSTATLSLKNTSQIEAGVL